MTEGRRLTTRDERERLDVVVIGAGVIGLAVARAFARAGREVVVVEAEPSIGSHASSRNSEVIHAGLYYEAGSRKARLCVAGRRLLYAYCEAAGVPHARTGKLIVAARDEELPALEAIRARAAENGVNDLVEIDAAEARALEPEVRCVRALLSPSTGIVDGHSLMQAFVADAERCGANVVSSTPVLSGTVEDAGIGLVLGGAEPASVLCRTVINAAGLRAQAVARTIAGVPPASIPPCHYAKGHYFVLQRPSPFSRLVYPVPVPGGLGVHVTLDLAGRARFGPDVSWVDGIDYAFDETRAPAFYEAVRRYYPALEDGALGAGYTGIRPKLGPSGSPASDFVIQGPEGHGVGGLVNLYGIESPGLTASLAIAEEVLPLP